MDASNENSEVVAKVPSETNNLSDIGPLSFIDPYVLEFFIKVEKKALGVSGKFTSDIRCAAFCEMLYEKKYIIQTKTRRITMNDFAKSRYGIDIGQALTTGKKIERKKHKNRKVDMQEPLKNCF